MELSIAEIFLGVWAVSATVLWQRKVYRHERFMHFTVMQLKKLVDGKARIIDTGHSIEIRDIEEDK